jgi:3D (Asp-Asp-Asp) domain-containing protein
MTSIVKVLVVCISFMMLFFLFPNEKAQMEEQDKFLMADFQVTFYNDYGITYSGDLTVEGITCAVDPDIIPLGSWLYIHMPDGTGTFALAQDTGSAVKGKVVDLYTPKTTSVLMSMGRVYGVKVEILGICY